MTASKKRKPRPAPIPSPDYAPGHFMALARKASKMNPVGWPPQFVATIRSDALSNGMTRSEQVAKQIDTAQAQGRYYATGTISLAGTPRNAKPKEWMR